MPDPPRFKHCLESASVGLCRSSAISVKSVSSWRTVCPKKPLRTAAAAASRKEVAFLHNWAGSPCGAAAASCAASSCSIPVSTTWAAICPMAAAAAARLRVGCAARRRGRGCWRCRRPSAARSWRRIGCTRPRAQRHAGKTCSQVKNARQRSA